nr:hypothetical protein CFP56_48649 [Quercus suber]
MENRSRSGPAHLKQPSISKESVHVDQHVRSEVHKKAQRQPSPPPQEEGTVTNTKGPSYYNRDGEVERLKEQVALLQRSTKKDKELLHLKDKKLHHQRGPSLAPSHSRAYERMLNDRNRKRDRRSSPPHGKQEQSPHKERIVSLPHHKNRREEQDKEKQK